MCYKFNSLLELFKKQDLKTFEKQRAYLLKYAKRHFKNYDADVDEKVFYSLIQMYVKQMPEQMLSEDLKDFIEDYDNDYKKLTKELFNETIFTNYDKIVKLFHEEEDADDLVDELKDDKVFELSMYLINIYKKKVMPYYQKLSNRINLLQRRYMQAQIETFPNRIFSPDANGSLRVAYGRVLEDQPNKKTTYPAKVYLSEVISKHKPKDYDFDLPKKLMNLYEQKNYGLYAENGKMPVYFIGTNRTTVGNSGSPVIDAYGNLIGLNFDSVWEDTMSERNYDGSIYRNVMVDVKYILFIIDKYAGAKYLIDEMTLVHPKERY